MKTELLPMKTVLLPGRKIPIENVDDEYYIPFSTGSGRSILLFVSRGVVCGLHVDCDSPNEKPANNPHFDALLEDLEERSRLAERVLEIIRDVKTEATERVFRYSVEGGLRDIPEENDVPFPLPPQQ